MSLICFDLFLENKPATNYRTGGEQEENRRRAGGEQVMADTLDNQKVSAGLEEGSSQLKEAMRELEILKTIVEKADDVTARMILEKLQEDDAKTKAQHEMLAHVKQQEECREEFTQSIKAVQNEILKLGKHRQDLLNQLRRCQDELEAKRAESSKLRQKFKINIQIPDTEVQFRGENKEGKEDEPIRGVFSISQRPTVLLRGGQALITFEEERVASQILKFDRCSVSCDNTNVDVKPTRITMEPAVKFEVHLDVSRKELMVSNVPSSMPEERIRDRLEMSFSRPSRGGGEVESVEYAKNIRTAQITFLHHGVAESLVLRGSYRVFLDSEVSLKTGPMYKYRLHKFQTFCGSPKQTIILDDIEDLEDEEDLQDHLEIYFQRPSNYGGEIESIRYISRGKTLQAFFLCEDTAEMEG